MAASPSHRTCQSNGYWTDEQPVCVELFCDMPAEVPHGIRDIGSLKVKCNCDTCELLKFDSKTTRNISVVLHM